MELLSLPDDVLIEQALYLDYNSINKLCSVNHRFRDLICDNDWFWRQKYFIDFGQEVEKNVKERYRRHRNVVIYDVRGNKIHIENIKAKSITQDRDEIIIITIDNAVYSLFEGELRILPIKAKDVQVTNRILNFINEDDDVCFAMLPDCSNLVNSGIKAKKMSGNYYLSLDGGVFYLSPYSASPMYLVEHNIVDIASLHFIVYTIDNTGILHKWFAGGDSYIPYDDLNVSKIASSRRNIMVKTFEGDLYISDGRILQRLYMMADVLEGDYFIDYDLHVVRFDDFHLDDSEEALYVKSLHDGAVAIILN